VILMLPLGCTSSARPTSSSLAAVPFLTVPARETACKVAGREERCIVILKADWTDVVLQAKAMCLALGGSAQACQTEPQ
jgi:hypothetical protein